MVKFGTLMLRLLECIRKPAGSSDDTIDLGLEFSGSCSHSLL